MVKLPSFARRTQAAAVGAEPSSAPAARDGGPTDDASVDAQDKPTEAPSTADRARVPAKPAAKPPTENLAASSLDSVWSGMPDYGRIEAFDGRHMTGWYFNLTQRTQSLSVTLDGKILCGTLANLPRSDVSGANPQAPERCGFFVDLDAFDILSQCDDLADLYARLKVVTASRRQLAHCYDDPFDLAATASGFAKLVSSFDGVDLGVARGWATTPKDPKVLSLHVFIDGIFQGETLTGIYREDIGDLHGDYNSGFAFPLSARFQDGMRHTVSCVHAATGEELDDSPKVLILPYKESIEQDRMRAVVDRSARLESELALLRDQVRTLALSGNAYLPNYPFYQDVIQPSGPTLARLMKKDLGAAPALFTIVMPTYRTDLDVLAKAIDSVVAQTDAHWELVISDSASRPGALRDALEARAAAEPRIRVIFNEETLGIADNTNVALRAALGEYVGFMDHDDEIAPEAISLNRAAFATGRYDIVYSDEDKIDVRGDFVDPHYKTAFNLDLLLSMNYICHLLVVRRSVLMETELNRGAFDGAQDWDMLLQMVRRVGGERIGHIPRVLYHWRMAPGSTALAIGEKTYAIQAGVNAVSDYLTATGAEAEASRSAAGLPYVDVRWRPEPGSKVSLLVPTKDRIDLVTNCVNSVLKTIGEIDVEILIVDNNSSRASNAAFQAMCGDPRIRLVRFGGAFNYSAINNFAAEQATGDYLLLLNNDVFFSRDGWLGDMLGIAQRPEVGAVGLKLLYPDNTIQHCGVVLGNGGIAGHPFSRLPLSDHGYFARTRCTHEVSAVTAACLLVRAETYKAVGGLDERDLTVAFNDVDFCMKLQKRGLHNIVVATTFAYHAESISRGYEDSLEKIARFQGEIATMKTRWGGALGADRFYSPNFALDHAPYTVVDLPGIVAQEAGMIERTPVR